MNQYINIGVNDVMIMHIMFMKQLEQYNLVLILSTYKIYKITDTISKYDCY